MVKSNLYHVKVKSEVDRLTSGKHNHLSIYHLKHFHFRAFSYTLGCFHVLKIDAFFTQVHLHGYDLTYFHQVFDKDLIPENFGGTKPSYDATQLIKALELREIKEQKNKA